MSEKTKLRPHEKFTVFIMVLNLVYFGYLGIMSSYIFSMGELYVAIAYIVLPIFMNTIFITTIFKNNLTPMLIGSPLIVIVFIIINIINDTMLIGIILCLSIPVIDLIYSLFLLKHLKNNINLEANLSTMKDSNKNILTATTLTLNIIYLISVVINTISGMGWIRALPLIALFTTPIILIAFFIRLSKGNNPIELIVASIAIIITLIILYVYNHMAETIIIFTVIPLINILTSLYIIYRKRKANSLS